MPSLTQVSFSLVEKISPKTAGKWGKKMWTTPAKYKISTREKLLMEVASKQRIPFNDGVYAAAGYYTLYSWGKGPVVLLVHGWNGSGSQMAAFAKPLVDSGYQVLTFDALAHGDSSGKQTDILEVSEIIKDLNTRYNGFHAIIAHSIGAIAAGIAISYGVAINKLVTCAAAASMDYYLKLFARKINASQHTLGKIAFHMNSRFKKNLNELSLINLGPQIQTPIFILHDEDDEVVDHREAIALSKCWPRNELHLTRGLGHHGILQDPATVSKVVNFVKRNSLGTPT